MLDRVDDALRAIDAERLLAPEQAAQQLIETGEMIHVEMRDEDVADAQQLARGKAREIAEIEQQRALLEHEIDVKARIVEAIVDELGIEMARHGASASGRSRRREPTGAGPRRQCRPS